MYCPKIIYRFTSQDINDMNQLIKYIANNRTDESGWFNVTKYDNVHFIDELKQRFTVECRGKFFRRNDTEFDLAFFVLNHYGFELHFDIEMFHDQV